MSSHKLAVFEHNARLELAERLPSLIDKRACQDEVLEICFHYRVLGICGLFLRCDPESLRINLRKSGQCFGVFLSYVRPEELVASRMAPLFDAMASNDFQLAGLLARAIQVPRKAGLEYEEDYLYSQLLSLIVNSPGDFKKPWDLVVRYDHVLDGDFDPRLSICKALLEFDSEGFRAAVLELLDAYAERMKRAVESDVAGPEVAVTEAKICVEALGLCRFAESRDWACHRDINLLPGVAFVAAKPASDPESWRDPFGD